MINLLNVALGERSYPIHIAPVAATWRALSGQMAGRRIFVVTDTHIARLYESILETCFSGAEIVVVEAGEGSKSLSSYSQLAEQILAAGLRRDSVIVAFGGGVVGDLAGFLAGTLMRGVGFIQIPTTVLAQVDSAVGGKTGVNTQSGKNLVGVFHQPDAVIADPAFLNTLSEREYRAGLAEVLKYGLIADRNFFDWLQENSAGIDKRDKDILAKIIHRSCEIKAQIVAQDERETTDIRAQLNFGHTFGHALELIAKFDGSLLHGEAVAIGMRMAAHLSASLGRLQQSELILIEAALKTLKLPYSTANAPSERMLEIMASDKKADKLGIRFVVLNKIGQTEMLRVADQKLIKQAIEAAISR